MDTKHDPDPFIFSGLCDGVPQSVMSLSNNQHAWPASIESEIHGKGVDPIQFGKAELKLCVNEIGLGSGKVLFPQIQAEQIAELQLHTIGFRLPHLTGEIEPFPKLIESLVDPPDVVVGDESGGAKLIGKQTQPLLHRRDRSAGGFDFSARFAVLEWILEEGTDAEFGFVLGLGADAQILRDAQGKVQLREQLILRKPPGNTLSLERPIDDNDFGMLRQSLAHRGALSQERRERFWTLPGCPGRSQALSREPREPSGSIPERPRALGSAPDRLRGAPD